MQKKISFLLIGLCVTLLVTCLSTPVVAQYEDEDEVEWSGFGFDTTSDSWQQAGERGYDLQNGRFVTLKDMNSRKGDFARVLDFSPYWVTLDMGGRKIVFSTSADNDDKVDNRVKAAPGFVPVLYGDSYVASYGSRTYTIQMLDGEYGLVQSSAQFLYRPGGTPAPEDVVKEIEPKKKSAPAASQSPEQIPGRINTLTVILKMPGADESVIFNQADLTLEFIGPAHFLTTYLGLPADGKKKKFTFYDIPTGTYNMEITWADKSIVQSVDLEDNMSSLNLSFY